MMGAVEKSAAGEAALAVVGLGYVGLPLAVAFARHFRVIGFDLNEEKIALYRQGHDVTEEVGDGATNPRSIRALPRISAGLSSSRSRDFFADATSRLAIRRNASIRATGNIVWHR